ncbi:MAG: weak similarity to aminoglycoside phosphotransferase, partial [uncultured Rubrobacteraceae bacterium]
ELSAVRSRRLRPHPGPAPRRGRPRLAGPPAQSYGRPRTELVPGGRPPVPEPLLQLGRPRAPRRRRPGRAEALFSGGERVQDRSRGAGGLRRAGRLPPAGARPRPGRDAPGAPATRRAANRPQGRRGGDRGGRRRDEEAVASRAAGPRVPHGLGLVQRLRTPEAALRRRNGTYAGEARRGGRDAIRGARRLRGGAAPAARRPPPGEHPLGPARAVARHRPQGRRRRGGLRHRRPAAQPGRGAGRAGPQRTPRTSARRALRGARTRSSPGARVGPGPGGTRRLLGPRRRRPGVGRGACLCGSVDGDPGI